MSGDSRLSSKTNPCSSLSIGGKNFGMKTKLSRRSALPQLAGSTAAFAVASNLSQRLAAAESAVGPKMKGHVNHSVCKWCYGKVPLEEFCQAAKDIGLQSVELLEVKDFDTLKKYGLTCD